MSTPVFAYQRNPWESRESTAKTGLKKCRLQKTKAEPDDFEQNLRESRDSGSFSDTPPCEKKKNANDPAA